MADCVSLPNAAGILKNIRWMYADEYWVQIAADAIEQLLRSNAKLTAMYVEKDETACRLYEENAKLKSAFDECYAANEDLFRKLEAMKAERDAAVAEIPKHCGTCKRFSSGEACLNDANECGWEWRGVPGTNVWNKEEEDATD